MSINIYKDGELKSVAGSGLMDAELSATSTNGVQNKVVAAAINELNNDLDIKFTNLNEIIRLTEATTSYQPINLDNIILICAELETSNNRRSNIIIPVSLLDNNTAKNFVINVYRDSSNSISVQFSLTKKGVNLFDIAPSGLQLGYFKLFGIY